MSPEKCNTDAQGLMAAPIFFTVNLAERYQSLLVDYIDVLRKVVGMVKVRYSFTINAMVSCLNICMR